MAMAHAAAMLLRTRARGMNCDDAAALIAAYTDAETDGPQDHSIRRLLVACPNCAARHDELLALRMQIRADVPRFLAPAALRARVLATLEAARPSAPSRSRPAVDRWRWLTGGALAGCAATMLSWSIGTTVLAWHANEEFAVEAVTSHVRATAGNQLIQVASSDQHTVKPWLSARLDYSPAVRDMAQEGFALTGGRVDYLDRAPIATLVYRFRDHNIDVFVRPESARASPTPLRSIRGFNVAHATGSGMDWLAVSDVNAAALMSFVERLAHEPGAL
jgi:anti-sigma factor RsiW